MKHILILFIQFLAASSSKTLIISALLIAFANNSHAQYSCNSATFIQVTDSCELTTYYQSGYDDRWFTFSPETPGVGFEIEWDYSPRWAYIPYDTLYIYTGSCDSLVEYAILSPIPSSGENYFNGDGDVFFRFTRDNSTPADIEIDLCVFSNFMDANCDPEIFASSQVICLGECFNITNNSDFFNIPNIYFELIIDPPAEIWNAAGTHYYGTYGVISGGQNYIPTFINTNDELKICPVNSGAHNIHAIWYDFLYHPDYIRCEDYEYIDVYDPSISDIDVFGTPCDLTPISTYIIPAFEVPCCVENINYSYTHTDQNPTLEIEWVFHENISINNSNYVY